MYIHHAQHTRREFGGHAEAGEIDRAERVFVEVFVRDAHRSALVGEGDYTQISHVGHGQPREHKQAELGRRGNQLTEVFGRFV